MSVLLLLLALSAGRADVKRPKAPAPMPTMPNMVVPLPDAPSPRRYPVHEGHLHFVQDKHFRISVGVTVAAETSDCITSARAQSRGSTEDNPYFGKHPSSARMLATDLPIELAVSYLAYRASRSENRVVRHLWWTVPAVDAVLHVGASIGNSRVCRPASVCAK